MNSFEHFILTRFNLNVAYYPPEVRLDPTWLHHRFELFDKFCYPSVQGQTTQDFKWLVFFDYHTPDEFKEKVSEYSSFRNFVPIYIKAETEQYRRSMRDTVMSRLSDRTQYVVTTRLDTDDALCVRFVETLYKIITDKANNQQQFINFTSGYMWNVTTSKLYLANSPSNMFLTLVEPSQHLKTVYNVNHNEASKFAPVEEIIAEPLWLEVIHGRNSVVHWTDGVRAPVKYLNEFAIRAAIPSRSDWLSCRIERGQKSLKQNLKRGMKALAPGLIDHLRAWR